MSYLKKKSENWTAKNAGLKCVLFLSLTSLVTVNIVLVNQSRNVDQESVYSATTAVFLIESAKLFVNLIILTIEKRSVKRALVLINTQIFAKWADTLKCSVPAFLYVIQNNLSYVALAYLDPGTFEVTLQVKLITTALLMKVLLGKVLAGMQWASLVMLLIGVCLAESSQFQSTIPISNSSLNIRNDLPVILSTDSSPKPQLNLLTDLQIRGTSHFFPGLSAALAITFTSALAGVYFEMLVKGSQPNNPDSSIDSLGISILWIRNLQMYLFSIPVAFLGCLTKDWHTIFQLGFFHDYDCRVWAIIVTGTLGGVATSLTLKFLDNIYKNFSSSLSIILASLCAILFSGKTYHAVFFVGSSMVCVSLFLYYNFGEVYKKRNMTKI